MPLLVPTTRPASQEFGYHFVGEPAGWFVKDAHGYLKAHYAHFPGSVYQADLHRGLDLYGPEGTPLLAAEAGNVTMAGASSATGGSLTVRVQIRSGTRYWYGHCLKALVPLGAKVRRGQPIALMGSTGHATGPHAHVAVEHLELGQWISYNPQRFYPPKTFRYGPAYGGTYLPSVGDLVNSDWVFPITSVTVNSSDVNLRLSPDTNAPIYGHGVPGVPMSQLNWVEGGTYTVGTVTGTTWAKVYLDAKTLYVAKPLVHQV